MDDQHKYVGFSGKTGKYENIIFCEYCGLVVWYSNNTRLSLELQGISHEPCPRTPVMNHAREHLLRHQSSGSLPRMGEWKEVNK